MLTEHIRVLILNAHGVCNCRCAMCDIWKRKTIEEIGAAEFDGRVECPEVLMGPVVDWIGAGVAFTLADFGWGAAGASMETAKTVPVIRTENPRRMSFLPV